MPTAVLDKSTLPDMQSSTDGFPKKEIQKVGIRNVQLPIKILRKDNSFNTSTAIISVYSTLNEKVKGTNMSRYREILEETFVGSIHLRDSIRQALDSVRDRLNADNAWLKVKFDYFLLKSAPVTRLKSHMNYKCVLEGRLINSVEKFYLTVEVPYTSCCPCSKELSEYGAHNQRSFASITVELHDEKIMWIEDIIQIVEKNASAPILNLLKREDEKWQTEAMYEKPMFVEDMARFIDVDLQVLIEQKMINDYVIVINHEESIHLHNAVAVMVCGKNGGLK